MSSPQSSSSHPVDKKPSGIGRLLRYDTGVRNKHEKPSPSHSRWSFGVLNDNQTMEVPGSVLLLAASHNEPLGLRNVHARTSHSSIPTGFAVDTPMRSVEVYRKPDPDPDPDPDQGKKKTEDRTIILEPQPEDSANDPLNWPDWRRDTALISLGFYCMIGGGIGSIMAAGFTDIANDYGVSVEAVSLTVGLYMMGLGLGAVLASPTAILFGKRPVYLASAIIFIGTCVWAGLSPSYPSLLAARVFQGISMSPVECLPSATIAEIFFLHERAYRIGIYTLLLLGGKNLIPLVSAAIIGRFGWPWVFFIVAMVAGLGVALLFLFVPETFWDRTPTRKPSKPPSFLRRLSSRRSVPQPHTPIPSAGDANSPRRIPVSDDATDQGDLLVVKKPHEDAQTLEVPQSTHPPLSPDRHVGFAATVHSQSHDEIGAVQMRADGQDGPSSLRSSIRPPRSTLARTPSGHYSRPTYQSDNGSAVNIEYASGGPDIEKIPGSALSGPPKVRAYTHNLRQQSAKTFTQQLRPYHGRLQNDKWVKVMFRPFILFSYPAVLWSAAVYACSVGWLMVMSEVLAMIYRDPSSYNFTSLQTGLVYISPFIGGILGTGVAGKISDIIVQAMSRRNGGLYEPEFRLVMALPIMLSTCIGLIGFGWSSEERDHFIVPTMFFGILSFGCSLGSTTSITFCVDSFRQYAGEALVTLNFAKNILHGLVFSLFVSHWLADDGPKKVFMWLGIIQLVLQLTTIPLFIFGKRARMWTVRKNFMERF